MSERLSDEALAELLAQFNIAVGVGGPAGDAARIGSALVREVQAARVAIETALLSISAGEPEKAFARLKAHIANEGTDGATAAPPEPPAAPAPRTPGRSD